MANAKKRRNGWIAAAVLLLCAVCAALYFNSRGVVEGVSPYRIVNNLGKAGEITFTAEYPSYPPSTRVIRVTIRNGADNWLIPETSRADEWVLEYRTGGAWHSLRAYDKDLCWDFPEEDYNGEARPSGIVEAYGGEQAYLCDLWVYYPLPLEPGRYRIVFPKLHLWETGTLAAEFDVTEQPPF